MLGQDVVAEIKSRHLPVLPLAHGACNITSLDDCRAHLLPYYPEVVINCAAYTKVDQAEADREAAWAVNATGAGNVAKVCKEAGARMIHVSTDYVFDGSGERPWTTDDPTGPLGAYGASKLEGERAVQEALGDAAVIVRTSWLYGANGPNFVKTMLRLAQEGRDLKIVSDQVGSPTYTVDLARALVDLALGAGNGIYHITNAGTCTWFEFAREIFRQSRVRPEGTFKPCTTSEYPTPARRPANSRMDGSRFTNAGYSPLPPWQDALRRYLLETEVLK